MADQNISQQYHEGYRLGLNDALTGGARVICGGAEIAQKVEGYLAGLRRGRELAKRHLEREAETELEAGL